LDGLRHLKTSDVIDNGVHHELYDLHRDKKSIEDHLTFLFTETVRTESLMMKFLPMTILGMQG